MFCCYICIKEIKDYCFTNYHPGEKGKSSSHIAKRIGRSCKKIDERPLMKKLKTAVNELNDIKAGKIEARDFDDLINEL